MINDESFVRIGVSTKNGIQHDSLDLHKSCTLFLPPDEGHIILSEFVDGSENLCMIAGMNFDEVDHANITPDFLDIMGGLQF